VNLRMRFVTDWQRDCWTMTELCADYQISRKTGYKWVGRFETAGPRGLDDVARRPAHSPTATDAALVKALLALRVRHPRWGARKLLAIAARQKPRAPWPSRSTVCALLKAHGLVAPRPHRNRHAHVPSALVPITAVNQTWTTDFKGHFRTGDGVYCYPLTLRDGFSRFVLRCEALDGPTYEATRPQFERAFADFGLPDCIRSDNGGPFASTGLRRLSRLSVWWLRLGIRLERIALGHPEQNGSHEQFHSVLKAATARPPAANARAQQQRFVRFCAEYNDDRPHEALDDRVPASCYQASRRLLPSRLPPIDYPAHWEIRRVSTIGQVSWGAQTLFLSGALAGEEVAFEEVDDGLWTVHFATLALCRYAAGQRGIQPIAALTEGRSPAPPARA
jgi:putative transposase